MRNQLHRLLSLSLLLGVTATAKPSSAAGESEMNAAERSFAEQMTGATLVGSFTIDGAEASPRLRSERYELREVRKVGDGKWMLQTRIVYGDKDLTLPITVPVEWVATGGPNPTPVIVIDNLFFPGAGTYSARVLFHDNSYAGRWSGATHGGALFGRIVPSDAAEPSEQEALSDPPGP